MKVRLSILNFPLAISTAIAVAGIVLQFVGLSIVQYDVNISGASISLSSQWFHFCFHFSLFSGFITSILTGTTRIYRIAMVALMSVAFNFVVYDLSSLISITENSGNAILLTGLFLLSFVYLPWILMLGSEDGSYVNRFFDKFTVPVRIEQSGTSAAKSNSLNAPDFVSVRSHEVVSMPVLNSSTSLAAQTTKRLNYNHGYPYSMQQSYSNMTAASASLPMMSNSARPLNTTPNTDINDNHQLYQIQNMKNLQSASILSTITEASTNESSKAKTPNPPLPHRTQLKSTLKAIALYSYSANPDDPKEMSFEKGDLLEIIDNNGKWWEAVMLSKIDGSRVYGIVPSNFLEIMNEKK